MPVTLPRLVPWTNRQEWEQVYSWLYAGNDFDQLALRDLGIKRVKAWSSRGKVPHAVDATASLLEAWRRDGCGGMYMTNGVTEHEIRLLYSMTFIRFVNGLVDTAQRGMYASSVASIADHLGLPGWFVDLRHSGTHDDLPSLPLLRAGCQQALQWLDENYWTMQKNYVADTTEEIRESLKKYKNLRKKKEKDTLGPRQAEELETALASIATTLTFDSYREILLPMLLERGFLVPLAKKKRSSYPSLTLPEPLSRIWVPALDRFEEAWRGFSEELFYAILAELDPSEGGSGSGGDAGCDEDEGGAEGGISMILLSDMSATDQTVAAKLKPFLHFIKKTREKDKAAAATAHAHTDSTPIPKDEPALLRTRIESLRHVTPSLPKTPPPSTPAPAEPTTAPWTLHPRDTWRPCMVGCLPVDGRGEEFDLGLPEVMDDMGYAVDAGILQYPVFEAGTSTGEEGGDGGVEDVNMEVGGNEDGEGAENEQEDMEVEMEEEEPAPKSPIDVAVLASHVELL
ncbi:rRNA-processing protein las1 [Borealophlyctis nickersoniae]|nr:rRNA-processing protein las1 [Borealophlyctis nickersoniae]